VSSCFSKKSTFPFNVKDLFNWHENLGAFDRLNPPWNSVEVLSSDYSIKDESKIKIGLPIGPFSIPWTLKHSGYEKNSQFIDKTFSGGPFSEWTHQHLFSENDNCSSTLEDIISFKLYLGNKFISPLVLKDLNKVFNYRHQILRQDLERHKIVGNNKLKIGITGANGMIGRSLTSFLSTGGHEIIKFVRNFSTQKKEFNECYYNPYSPNPNIFEGLDVLILLAGEPIASSKWSNSKKQEIIASRSIATKCICDSLNKCINPPNLLISTSGINIYGTKRDELLNESSTTGTGFLAEVCKKWEDSVTSATKMGIRTVILRFGIVLSPNGGALGKMLTPFMLGGGGVIGSGKQYLSWITLRDLIYLIHSVIFSKISGTFNAVSPVPVSNFEFTKTLGKVLNRPTIIPIPESLIKLIFGEMGKETILSDLKVSSKKLQSELTNFSFLDISLEEGLSFMLGRYTE
jgi:uncharacterized protein